MCWSLQVEVLEIALDQCGPATERKLAIVDKNRDLFLTSVRIFGTERKSTKMGKNSRQKTKKKKKKKSLFLKIVIF